MLTFAEKREFLNEIKGKKIIGSWWKKSGYIISSELEYYIPTGEQINDKFECKAYKKDGEFIEIAFCEFKNGFSDHYGSFWELYNDVKEEIQENDTTCKHLNKREVRLIYSTYMYCPDCKDKC